VTEIDSLKQL